MLSRLENSSLIAPHVCCVLSLSLLTQFSSVAISEMQAFPFFADLPNELVLLIVKFATSPGEEDFANSYNSCYAVASALCATSFAIRSAAVPHLLETVVLATHQQVVAFSQAIELQTTHRQRNSRLQLDYNKLIKRMWIDEHYPALVDSHPVDSAFNYAAMYSIIRSVPQMVCNSEASDVFYEGVCTEGADPATDLTCRSLTLIGSQIRWNPFISSVGGVEFLKKVTHVVLVGNGGLFPGGQEFNLVPSIRWKHFQNLKSACIPFEMGGKSGESPMSWSRRE